MAKLVMSPEAKADLKEIAGYIAHKRNNPDAALRLLRRIKEDTSKLRKFAEMGTPLGKSGDVEYRYIICGSYMVFHHYQEGTVYIDRILYGRRDYMAILFGALLEDTDAEAQSAKRDNFRRFLVYSPEVFARSAADPFFDPDRKMTAWNGWTTHQLFTAKSVRFSAKMTQKLTITPRTERSVILSKLPTLYALGHRFSYNSAFLTSKPGWVQSGCK